MMGICLGTDQQNGSQVFENHRAARDAWLQESGAWTQDASEEERFSRTPPDGRFPMHNGHVKFEVPKVPVIFVLGGPGSGKVTHCDNLMQEKRGITHINMTDLLQQYAVGNDLKDFGQLSSSTVTEVLMLEMKMAPASKTYLVSGYPRNMRDVVEYSEKIQIVNGVVLVSWRQKVLERQIDYGAKLGHVVLGMAKMELDNFYKKVMPVADYFDQRGMLQAVNGERNPNDVYKDFRTAVLRTLGVQDQNGGNVNVVAAKVEAIPRSPVYKAPAKGFPPVIWVIGGPGSNKSALCQKAVRQAQGWVHLSVGRLLRTAAESTDPRHGNDAPLVRQNIAAGEMVPETVVLQLVESQMNTNMNAQGIVMDGFPRNMNQVYDFENKFKQQPTVVLLDCSKLQLGRGRLDDSVAAFRRRLELFRELSLPMLRTLDGENRLLIVDGDTDTPQVQEDFCRAIQQHVDQVKRTGGMIVPEQSLAPHPQQYDVVLHDLESEDAVHTISRRIHNGNPVRNGAGANGNAVRNGGPLNTVPVMNHYTRVAGQVAAVGRPSRDTIRDMYANVESYPMDAHL